MLFDRICGNFFGNTSAWLVREYCRQDKVKHLLNKRAKLDEKIAKLTPHEFTPTEIDRCTECGMQLGDAIHSGGRPDDRLY